jgi:hypothetical protein
MAGPEQSIVAVFFFRDVATAEDRRCDSEPEIQASEAGTVGNYPHSLGECG